MLESGRLPSWILSGSLQAFASRRIAVAWNHKTQPRVIVMLPFGRKTTMRWKISRHGHDPRQVDLLAIIAIVVLIVAAYGYFTHEESTTPSKATALIVPSDHVRW
jgi:hypothetical protein